MLDLCVVTMVTPQSLDRENEMPTTEHQLNIEKVHSSTHHTKDTVQNDSSSVIKEYQNFRCLSYFHCILIVIIIL